MADPRIHSLDFVGSNTGSHPGAAQQNSAPGFATMNGFADFYGQVGIIHRLAVKRAQVQRLMAGSAHRIQNHFFQRKTGVVTGYGHFHFDISSRAFAATPSAVKPKCSNTSLPGAE